MWGLFVGIAIGLLQIAVLRKLGKIITGGSAVHKLLAGVLFIVKIAVIVAILYLLSTVSMAHLIWAAGGTLLGLVAASVFLLKRQQKKDGDDRHIG